MTGIKLCTVMYWGLAEMSVLLPVTYETHALSVLKVTYVPALRRHLLPFPFLEAKCQVASLGSKSAFGLPELG